MKSVQYDPMLFFMWSSTVVILIFTALAAFAVPSAIVIALFLLAILYSSLKRFREKLLVRNVMRTLVAIHVLAILFFLFKFSMAVYVNHSLH